MKRSICHPISIKILEECLQAGATEAALEFNFPKRKLSFYTSYANNFLLSHYKARKTTNFFSDGKGLPPGFISKSPIILNKNSQMFYKTVEKDDCEHYKDYFIVKYLLIVRTLIFYHEKNPTVYQQFIEKYKPYKKARIVL